MREWRASGQSAAEYARGHGLAESTLRWWASRLGKRAQKRDDCAVRMLPVLRAARPTSSPRAALTVRVGAAQIEVGAGFDASLLREVVQALGGAS